MDNPLSAIFLFLFLSIPVVLILANLERIRKRDLETRKLQEETNRLLAEIASLLKSKS